MDLDDGTRLEELLTPYVAAELEAAWTEAASALALRDLAFNLANPFVQSAYEALSGRVKGIVETTEEQITGLVRQAAAEGWDVARLRDAIRQTAADQSRSRAQMLAVTELAQAHSLGSLAAWQESGVVEGVEWLVSDPCPEICEPLAGKVVPLGEAFAEGITNPPAHPRCRCSLSPVLAPG